MKFSLLDILLPRETKFFDYLSQQVDVLTEGSRLFRDLVTTLDSLSNEEVRKFLDDIKDCEMRGDDVERMIIAELHETFITPIDREDIHTMAINIDRALDILYSVARKIDIYSSHQRSLNFLTFLLFFLIVNPLSNNP